MTGTDELPSEYRERFLGIVALTDAFCDRLLNDEYKNVTRKMAARLCQQDASVLRGKLESWACGLMHATGKVNFLFDSTQTPHLKAEQVAKGFGVSSATMQAKSREIQNCLDLIPFEPDFTIASLVEENPLMWLVELNGFMIDLRYAPRDLQVSAYEQGIIPYIPADQDSEA